MTRRQYPHLARAPIVEALVDFRVSEVSERSVERLGAVRSQLADRYPKSEDYYRLQAEISLGQSREEAGEISSESQHIGYRLRSNDEKNIAVLTTEGFTVSRLRPYDRWESLREEAHSIWPLYQQAVDPHLIRRVALRYINRLELPSNLRDFRDYLTAPPEVPPRLPQTLQGFVTRIVIPIPRLGASAIITQQLEGTPGGSQVFVLLDIDVFKAVDIPTTGAEPWELADALRNEKNVIFFESITEQMEELCS